MAHILRNTRQKVQVRARQQAERRYLRQLSLAPKKHEI